MSSSQSAGPPEESKIFQNRKRQRNVVAKLELPDDPFLQQRKVAASVFDTEISVLAPAEDNSAWHTTDTYFETAKANYDSILSTFQKPPKVYKLETRSKLDETVPEEKKPNPVTEQTSQEVDDELNTMLNPYAMPKPWVVKYDRDDNLYYYNEDTGARKIVKPRDVWHEKLERLSKLIPKEDYSGWEYKEDDKEKRSRIRTQLLFEKKLQEEIKRRQENPTDDEIIEDVLYSIVATIEKEEQREAHREANRERKALRATWHPSSIGFRMKQLELLPRPEIDDDENTSSEVPDRMDRRVTDIDYSDIYVISDTGYVLPKTMPADLMEIHEAEREEKRMLQEALEMEEERIRKLPVMDKASMLIHQVSCI